MNLLTLLVAILVALIVILCAVGIAYLHFTGKLEDLRQYWKDYKAYQSIHEKYKAILSKK